MIALSTPLRLVPFVSVDVETTGLDPGRDQIVEIGAVRVREGAIVDEFQTLVSIDGTIPLAARRVHGITNRMLVGQPLIADALNRFLAFAGDGPLVEHSYQVFDIAFLEQALGSAFTVPCLNTCTLSRKLFPFLPSHSLEVCCRRHEIVNHQQHRALSDARATAQLLLCLLEAGGHRYPRLEDLVKVAAVERQSDRNGPPRRGTRRRR